MRCGVSLAKSFLIPGIVPNFFCPFVVFSAFLFFFLSHTGTAQHRIALHRLRKSLDFADNFLPCLLHTTNCNDLGRTTNSVKLPPNLLVTRATPSFVFVFCRSLLIYFYVLSSTLFLIEILSCWYCNTTYLLESIVLAGERKFGCLLAVHLAKTQKHVTHFMFQFLF